MMMLELTALNTVMTMLMETELKEDILVATRKVLEMIGQITNTVEKEAEPREMPSLKGMLITSEMVMMLDITLVTMTITVMHTEMDGLTITDGVMTIIITTLVMASIVLIKSQ